MLAWDQLRPVVLGRIGDEEVSGADLRARLAADISLSPLAFLGMMATLERTGLVSGRTTTNEIGEAAGAGRLYRLTSAGRVSLAGPRPDDRPREAA